MGFRAAPAVVFSLFMPLGRIEVRRGGCMGGAGLGEAIFGGACPHERHVKKTAFVQWCRVGDLAFSGGMKPPFHARSE